MKNLFCCCLMALLLSGAAAAAEVPGELARAVPDQAQALLGEVDLSSADSLGRGIGHILRRARQQAETALRRQVRGAVRILLAVLLCGVLDGFCRGTGSGGAAPFLSAAGALTVALLAAGSLDTLIGLGAGTLSSMRDFSSVLLPVLAAAAATAGAVASSGVQQVTAVFFVDLLLRLIDGVLLPLVYLYIGISAAAAMLPESTLSGLGEALKRVVVWTLSAVLLAFTVYLTAVRVIVGSADGAAVKVAKAAVSGAIPVVGGILADATETVLAGAAMLKSAIGLFGTLVVVAICALPFLQLGVQFLLYKLAALLAQTVGTSNLCKLIDALGSAFGLVLGMTGAGAVLLLISILSAVSAVTA